MTEDRVDTATDADSPESRSPRRGSSRLARGVAWLAAALVALVVMSFLPTDYVVQQPGPVYNTIGEVDMGDGEAVPLIEVDGAETYPTEGALDLTTVQVVGNREHRLSWVELALAWGNPSRAILPLDSVYPEGVTTEERDEQNAALMTDSQGQAAAAALIQLGYDVPADIRVAAFAEDAPAEGILAVDDRIVAAEGQELADVSELQEIIGAGEGDPVELTIERDGARAIEPITPVERDGAWIIGVSLSTTYDLPVDVTIQLDNVGGPSAGTMFALGIIDVLTPEELTGGQPIAGTGTITATGEVGPIGGIRQKLYGARDAGAEYFLAPEENCDEVVGHVPGGLQVVSVGTLDDALAAVEAIAAGAPEDLPGCAAE
ncbi:PDZ domain-containing protein [Microbacterium sp. ZXX196]|uniref:PDZ domain-containing protein n=1 Tax=Microbacterium sp. ZXX196 TaxID=2609291 RepID=UPI0034D2B42A